MAGSGIYRIESKLKPERIYIGSAININRRWNGHLRDLRKNIHHSKKMQNHFNKYGIVDLMFSIILGCDKEDLLKIEQYFLDTYNPYFNTCKIAGNTLGIKYTDEVKKKISIYALGNKKCLGRVMSNETRNKISNKKKGISTYIMGNETKLKLSKAFKGKTQSEDTKQKFGKGWELRRLKLNKPRSKYLIKKYGT